MIPARGRHAPTPWTSSSLTGRCRDRSPTGGCLERGTLSPGEMGGKMRVHFTPSPALYPFESRWFETDGIRVHYIDEGTGRPILMCHGNPTWSFLYRKLIGRLRGRFRCVAADYPGFGLSDRPEGYGYTPA